MKQLKYLVLTLKHQCLQYSNEYNLAFLKLIHWLTLPYIFYDSWENFGQKSKEVDFLNGKKDGLSTEWYENGQKNEEGIFKDDEKNGLWTSWYKNGQKMVEVKFKDGVEIEGTLWDYWENGQKRMEEYYKDGKYISEKEWNKDGSLKE